MSEFLNIDNKLNESNVIVRQSQNPIIYAFILLAAVAVGVYSMIVHAGENTGFALLFVAAVLAAIGLRGIIFPSKILKYAPTGEKITKAEYFYDNSERGEIEECLQTKGYSRLKSIPQGKGTSLRVILYSTATGSYCLAQLQHFVPYEYRAVTEAQ